MHSWICAFLSNHLCWCSTRSNSLSSSVGAFHSSIIQSNPCSCPCFPLPLPLPCLPLLCLPVPWPNVPLHSQYVLISSLKTPYEVNLARFNCTCFSRSSGNKASRELMRMSSARLCAFPWAPRRLQKRLTRFSIFSMAPQAISFASATESPSRDFVLVPLCTDSTFRTTCANSRSHGHLLLTLKLSPSVRADNTTKSCPSISANVSTPSSGTAIATVAAVTTSCDSTAYVKAPRTFGNTPDT